MALDPMVALVLEWGTIVVLVFFSALFSGLNLGLMSLDPIGLKIVMASDNLANRRAAQKIQPLRKHGNWLLCTLLIGNVAVNAALSILLADKTSGTIGFFVSTVTITIFGEIIPQALCSRYALEIGARTVWIVWPLMWILCIIAYPVSYILDRLLGQELGTVYSNKELQKLVEIHANIEGTGVNDDTAEILKGALGLKDALISNCMTSMSDVFWLSDSSKLSFDVLTEIFKSGHSRIPIFNTSDNAHIECAGLLYVKDLILLDPDDEMPVSHIMNAFKHKEPPIIGKNDTLQHLLEIFVTESQHLAFVTDTEISPDNTEYVGIITLEDVIEHVLQTQLIDEHDNFVDNKHILKTNRLNRINWNMLHIFDHRHRVLTTLPPQELQAVYHFLSQTIKPFTPQNRVCSEASIKNLLATSSVLRVVISQDTNSMATPNSSRLPRKTMQSPRVGPVTSQLDPYKMIEDNGLLLYERDKKTPYFTLLLDGKCEIYAGRQGFRCELTRWSYLCPQALDQCVECYRYNKPLLDFAPDFTAKVIENSRVLRIKLTDFRACLEGQFDFDRQAQHNMRPTGGRLNISAATVTGTGASSDDFFTQNAHNKAVSLPHIVTGLPTPHNISDNSQPPLQAEHKMNVAYHLMDSNNLSNSPNFGKATAPRGANPNSNGNERVVIEVDPDENDALFHDDHNRNGINSNDESNDDGNTPPANAKEFLYQPVSSFDIDGVVSADTRTPSKKSTKTKQKMNKMSVAANNSDVALESQSPNANMKHIYVTTAAKRSKSDLAGSSSNATATATATNATSTTTATASTNTEGHS